MHRHLWTPRFPLTPGDLCAPPNWKGSKRTSLHVEASASQLATMQYFVLWQRWEGKKLICQNGDDCFFNLDKIKAIKLSCIHSSSDAYSIWYKCKKTLHSISWILEWSIALNGPSPSCAWFHVLRFESIVFLNFCLHLNTKHLVTSNLSCGFTKNKKLSTLTCPIKSAYVIPVRTFDVFWHLLVLWKELVKFH